MLRRYIEMDLAEDDVRTGLNKLAAEGLLDWHGDGDTVVHISPAQMKRLARFYREE